MSGPGATDHDSRLDHAPRKTGSGLRGICDACAYSFAGLAAAFRHERAFRQELLAAFVLIPLALVLPAGGIGKALMVGSVLLVLIVELLNSAIEAIVDRASPERHPLAKRAKDIGSAAVLVSLVSVPVIWALVLYG